MDLHIFNDTKPKSNILNQHFWCHRRCALIEAKRVCYELTWPFGLWHVSENCISLILKVYFPDLAGSISPICGSLCEPEWPFGVEKREVCEVHMVSPPAGWDHVKPVGHSLQKIKIQIHTNTNTKTKTKQKTNMYKDKDKNWYKYTIKQQQELVETCEASGGTCFTAQQKNIQLQPLAYLQTNSNLHKYKN